MDELRATIARVLTDTPVEALVTKAHVDDLTEELTVAVSALDCTCTGVRIQTDYGTGIEHDVDRNGCALHHGRVEE